MAMRTLSTLFGGTIVATIALMLQGCPDQPEIKCLLAKGPFSTRLDLISASDPDETRCPLPPLGNVVIVGVEQYFQPTKDKLQDLDSPSVALKIEDVQNYYNSRTSDPCSGGYGLKANEEDKLYSLGDMNSGEPAGDFCTVGTMSPARLRFDASEAYVGPVVEQPPAEELPGTGVCPEPPAADPDAGTGEETSSEAGEPETGTDTDAGADPDAATSDPDATTGDPDAAGEADAGETDAGPTLNCEQLPDNLNLPAIDAEDTTYEWSNVRFIVTPSIIGHAFDGDLTVTSTYTPAADPSARRQCTFKYKANGLFYYKAFGNRLCAKTCATNGDVGPADDKYCDDRPDPEDGFTFGSQINPDLPVKCDPVAKMCVLAKDVKDL